MVDSKLPHSSFRGRVSRRWMGGLYGVFALALLVLVLLQPSSMALLEQPLVLFLLGMLALATPATAALIGWGRARRTPIILLLAFDALVALGLVLASGGIFSPLWICLLLASTAAPLLLPGRWSVLLLACLWVAYGLMVLLLPENYVVGGLLFWALRLAGVALLALVLHQALAAEEIQREAAQRREHTLREFLELSARLRVSSQPNEIISEVARVVQANGSFNCVTMSRVDGEQLLVMVAYGASGRRLSAVEGLVFPWEQLAENLLPEYQVGPSSYRLRTLPFRSIRNEQHLVLPLIGLSNGVQGLLTVSFGANQVRALEASEPLLELLANQASAVLENSQIYATLEQRVVTATATINNNRAELALARDRAETLYQVVAQMTNTLDERELLQQALRLVRDAVRARWGVIMLVEPNTGMLAVRTSDDLPATVLARVQQYAGIVLAKREPLIVADLRREGLWPESGHETNSLLAVPLMLGCEPVGIFVLGGAGQAAFNNDHAQLALAAGSQMASALSKAQLYRFVSEQSERLGHTLQLREEEISKNQAILSSIGEGVVVGDRLGRVRMVNPAAESLLGITAAEYIGRPMSDLPGSMPSLFSDQSSGQEQIELTNRTLRAHYTPVLSPNALLLGGVVVYHDVTNDVVADRVKSSFLATASHELRTPLTSIRGYVDLLLLGTIGALSEQQRDFLQVVKHNIAQLVDLIDDILDVSKVEAGEIRLRRVSLDVSEIVYEVAESLYSNFAEKSIALAIDVAPDLPQVMADRQRLRQIIVNLVSNACKYTPDHGKVDVVVQCVGEELQVAVRDTGVGIAPEAQAHIFTPFYRAENPLRDAAGGTGLGLSITKTLIELHGGRIWFDTVVNEGTTFVATLPLQGFDWTQPAWMEVHANK